MTPPMIAPVLVVDDELGDGDGDATQFDVHAAAKDADTVVLGEKPPAATHEDCTLVNSAGADVVKNDWMLLADELWTAAADKLSVVKTTVPLVVCSRRAATAAGA